ncbi:MAG: hypothetical protein H0W96_11060 [Solirubrobacterales bacterium]|nr:hypothetical protein [Solirubrobacterales bacterium]
MTADFQSGGRADRLCLMAVDPQPDQWWLDDPLPSIDSWPFRRGERVGPPGDVRIAVAEEGRGATKCCTSSRGWPASIAGARAYARRLGEATGETGTLASLAPLIGDGRLYSHVMTSDMTLKADGLDGPWMFRVLRWDLWPVVTAEIKTALDERGVTGVSFQLLHTKR